MSFPLSRQNFLPFDEPKDKWVLVRTIQIVPTKYHDWVFIAMIFGALQSSFMFFFIFSASLFGRWEVRLYFNNFSEGVPELLLFGFIMVLTIASAMKYKQKKVEYAR